MSELQKIETLVDGLACSYLQTGNGKPIIFLHGWAQSSETWKELGAAFPGHTAYAPDMPGFGASDIPPKTWTIKDYARWVHMFAQQLNLEDVVIIGHSFGARVAAEYAKRYPLRKLVLIATGGAPKHSWFRTLNKVIIALCKSIVPTLLYRAHAHLLTPRGYTQTHRIDKSRARTMLALYDTTHVADETLFSHISCPTLLIYGENDWIAPVRTGVAIHAAIPQSKFVIIVKAGHFTHITNAQEVIQCISKFLDSTSTNQ